MSSQQAQKKSTATTRRRMDFSSILTITLFALACILFGISSQRVQQMDQQQAENTMMIQQTHVRSKGRHSEATATLVIEDSVLGGEGGGGQASSQRQPPIPTPDAYFNTLPLIHRSINNQQEAHSTTSCVGENFQNDAWQYRSCLFTHLCFDMTQQDFVLVASPQEKELLSLLEQQRQAGADDPTTIVHHLSNLLSNKTSTVAIGGINRKWKQDSRRLEWFPRIVTDLPPEGYYALPDEIVWIPYHSLAGYNIGHLFWDDFLPIYKLLSMFNLIPPIRANSNQTQSILLTKIELKLWGTCDWNPKRREQCQATFAKFLPAMGISNDTFSSTYDFVFSKNDDSQKQTTSNLVCSRQGLAGLGLLTDHGHKLHGWDDEDYKTTHNAGRGPVFYDFSQFLLDNLLGPDAHTKLQGPPYRLIFSKFSSSTKGRVKGFGKQSDALKTAIQLSSKDDEINSLQLEGYKMSERSIQEQALLTSTASIFVTVVGGGAMTATFLPRGATLICFYESKGGLVRNKETGKPARLDWDVLNHASHLRVHWLPVETMDKATDIALFVALVKQELHIISHASNL